MVKSALQPGDVLIFQAEDSWISKLIAWGTNSDVSHAAMLYEDGKMVEMGLGGIMISRIQEGEGETAYQLRLSPQKDPAPLQAAARYYVDEKICYDVPALVLLGIALIYRHIHPSTRVYYLLDQVLTLACVELNRLINKIRRHPDAMVCSQLVYQVYMDCGGEYQLILRNGVLQGSDRSMMRLIDLAAEHPAAALGAAPYGCSTEALYKDLFEALTQDTAAEDETAEMTASLAGAAAGLRERLTELAEVTGQPYDSLLVMPADLAYHTENLDRLDTVKVERVK